MAVETRLKCDVYGTHSGVRRERLVREILEDGEWHVIDTKEADLSPRASNRVARFVNRAFSPPAGVTQDAPAAEPQRLPPEAQIA